MSKEMVVKVVWRKNIYCLMHLKESREKVQIVCTSTIEIWFNYTTFNEIFLRPSYFYAHHGDGKAQFQLVHLVFPFDIINFITPGWEEHHRRQQFQLVATDIRISQSHMDMAGSRTSCQEGLHTDSCATGMSDPKNESTEYGRCYCFAQVL